MWLEFDDLSDVEVRESKSISDHFPKHERIDKEGRNSIDLHVAVASKSTK